MLMSCYQGKRAELKLYVQSTFKHKMTVRSLSGVRDDPRFTFHTSGASKITPGQKSFVGKVIFDPSADCEATEDCYTGFSPDSKFGRPWYLGLAMPLNLAEMDLAVVHSLWSRMKAVASPSANFNVSLRLDTSEVKGFLLTARASLSWPVISNLGTVRFPLTQLGNSTRKHVIVTNPSSKPLLVHLVPMTAYPNAASVVNLLPHRKTLGLDPETVLDPEDAPMFAIESVENADNPSEPLETFGDNFSEKFGVEVSSSTFPVILQPGQSAKVAISFTPEDPPGPRATVLFVRNNLTGVDLVDLVGSGAVGDIKFGNRRPGSVIHAFEVTEKHLKDCDKPPTKQQHILPNLTVKRPFTARNSGQVNIWVTGFEIDGKACEGYGFKVLDCEPFLLAANDSKKINIAFTPDFTLSRVTRSLTLKTSLGRAPGEGDIKYSLAATVPPHLLPVCARSLPRPGWEIIIYYGTLTLLTVSLCCVVIAAFVEADRILKFCFLLPSPSQQSYSPENCKPFDLKEIARNAALESDKRIEAAENTRLDSPSRQDPSFNMISQNPSNVEILKKTDKDLSSIFLRANQDLKNNKHSNTQTKFSLIQKFVSILRFMFGTVISSTPEPIENTSETNPEVDQVTLNNKDTKETKKEIVNNSQPTRKSPEVKKSKAANKKNIVKPKLTAQNSIDEIETSSTTTESSNPEEITESFSKGIQSITSNGCEPSGIEQSKKKKKTKAKTEEVVKENTSNKATKKKQIEKQDLVKQESKVEKQKLSPKSSTESPKVHHPPQKPETPPPVTKPKQEAKVKGVPKETSELRRQQSAPAYDRPPRLQPQGARKENYGAPPDGFPPVSLAQKPDPPRAIILPELKQNPGSQFGAIGCKVPSNGVPTKSTWTDSPAAPNPVTPGARMLAPAGGPASTQTLMPPPGLTIMQQLQQERRKREEDYHRRQNNWPGFNDTAPPTTGLVGTPNNYVDNLWDVPSSNGLWGTIGNVWPSSVFNSGFNERNMNRETENLGLDSLSLSSIWSAGAGQQQEEENNTWSSLFSDNKKDM